jgi:hypothetical protein
MTQVEPLLVSYPHGGEHVILHWQTDHDRAHLVVARTERAALDVACVIADLEPYAELKSMSRVEIVAPPRRLAPIVAEVKRGEAIDMFRREIAVRMAAVLEVGEKLPPLFSVCRKFTSDNANADDWARETHHGCKNCIDKIVIAMKPVPFYDKFAKAWEETQPSAWHRDKRDPDRSRIVSRGRVVEWGEPLFCAWKNFGDHAPGVELLAIDTENLSWLECYSTYCDNILFYFQKLGSLDDSVEKVTRMFAEARQKDEEKIKKDRSTQQEEFHARTSREVMNALAFFKEHA